MQVESKNITIEGNHLVGWQKLMNHFIRGLSKYVWVCY